MQADLNLSFRNYIKIYVFLYCTSVESVVLF